MHKTLALVSLMGVAAIGCGDGDVDGTLGELGEGVFRYACIEDGDARCNETNAVSSFDVSAVLGIDPELPTAIAVGARFDLSYVGDTIDDGDFLIVDVEPARTDLVTHAGGFVIEAPGTFAFLARNGPKKTVADFVHLDALTPSGIDIWHDEERKSTLDLTVTNTAELAAVPVANGDIPLAGALGVAWTTSDASVVAIGAASDSATPSSDKELNDDEIRLIALAVGTATLTVTQGELTSTIEVTVGPEVLP